MIGVAGRILEDEAFFVFQAAASIGQPNAWVVAIDTRRPASTASIARAR